jgi:hypothetical protein
MTDPAKEKPKNDLPNAAWMNRLVQRSTNPVGVINARHPQQLHARTAGWMAERYGWLDHWRTRYLGTETQSTGGGLIFTSALPRSASLTGDGRNETEILARQTSVPLHNRPNAPAVNEPGLPTPLLRIRRPGAPPPESSSTPIVQRKAGETAVIAEDTQSGLAKRTTPLRGIEINVPTEAATLPLLLPKQEHEIESRDQSTTSSLSVPERSTRDQRSGALEVVSNAPNLQPSIKVDTGPVESSSPGSVLLARSREIVTSAISPTGEWQLPAARSKESHAARSQKSPDQSAVAVRSEELIGAAEGPGKEIAIPAVGVTTPLPLVQRRPAEPNESHASDSESADAAGYHQIQAATKVDGAASQRGVAVVKEISPDVSVPPQMIWRKNESWMNNNASHIRPTNIQLNASPLAVQRSISTPSPDPGLREITSSADKRASDVNVARLAEQVSRLLARQLIVERERRGMS